MQEAPGGPYCLHANDRAEPAEETVTSATRGRSSYGPRRTGRLGGADQAGDQERRAYAERRPRKADSRRGRDRRRSTAASRRSGAPRTSTFRARRRRSTPMASRRARPDRQSRPSGRGRLDPAAEPARLDQFLPARRRHDDGLRGRSSYARAAARYRRGQSDGDRCAAQLFELPRQRRQGARRRAGHRAGHGRA